MKIYDVLCVEFVSPTRGVGVPGRPRSKSVRTTLYRLTAVASLQDALREKYLEDEDRFTKRDITVGEREGFLLYGAMQTERVKWAEQVGQYTGATPDLGNITAAAVLLLRAATDPSSGWALSYGMGFQLLEPNKVDQGFGQRVAIRSADPDDLSSLTRTTLDQRARIDRNSIPGGEDVRGFGVGDFGEIITRLVAKAQIQELTSEAPSLTLRGADSLSVPLGKRPEALLADLQVIEAILDQTPVPELEILEQIRPVKREDEKERLDAELETALSADDSGTLGLAWPSERIDENGAPSSYKFQSTARHLMDVEDGTPELEDVVLAIRSSSSGPTLVEKARNVKIMIFRDSSGEEAISSAIPALRWLAFETEAEGSRYCLHNGSWYLMDQNYAAKLQRETQRVFSRTSGLRFPPWYEGLDEASYNTAIAGSIGGTLLDTKLITTTLHRRGIEPCDVLGPNGELIHVKKVGRSSSASHLIAQSLVSTDALLVDEEARSALKEKVKNAGGQDSLIGIRPHTVILVLGRDRPITPVDLFSFTKVTLVRHANELESRGVDVFVVPVAIS